MMATSRKWVKRIGETTEVGEGGEENPALVEAECRSQLRGTPETMTELLAFPNLTLPRSSFFIVIWNPHVQLRHPR